MIQFLRAGILTVFVTAFVWASLRFFWMRRHHRQSTLGRELFLLLAICYAAAVAAVVIMPVAMTRNRTADSATNNFIPFHSMHAAIDELARNPGDLITHDTANVIGNILMFIPLGLLLPLLFVRLRTFRNTALTALAISVGIELAQLVSRSLGVFRSVDVDDVILNVAGACIGYVFYRVWRGDAK